MRKMATIRKIDNIRLIEGADAIECAAIGGWNVVIRKGEYTAGNLAVYCEIDSFIPTKIAPFLTKPNHFPKTFNDVQGERLRTIKLRGQLSQGLLLPCSIIQGEIQEGMDVSDLLGVQKWEAPIPSQLASSAEGAFPSLVPKTDQERIQNLTVEFTQWLSEKLHWEVTEKLDGSSMTVFNIDSKFGVCSRNWELKDSGGTFWAVTHRYNLPTVLPAEGNFAIQGELIGEGIQGNPYKLTGHDFYVYDIYDIDNGCYLNSKERLEMTSRMGLKHCPVLAHSAELFDTLGITTIDQLLKFAEGKTVMPGSTAEREGVVFKCIENQVSFKSISNIFLLKHGN